MVNVDLLIKNKLGQTLLTWRDDGYYPPCWHIPGGIIRYKETFTERIKEVARIELGAVVEYESSPLAINEVIHNDRKDRGHFISLLYQCRLLSPLDEKIKCNSDFPQPGQWKWHTACPDNLIEVHDIYRNFI